jgi:hypothetical protein
MLPDKTRRLIFALQYSLADIRSFNTGISLLEQNAEHDNDAICEDNVASRLIQE